MSPVSGGRVRGALATDLDRVAALWTAITHHHEPLDAVFAMRREDSRGGVVEGQGGTEGAPGLGLVGAGKQGRGRRSVAHGGEDGVHGSLLG